MKLTNCAPISGLRNPGVGDEPVRSPAITPVTCSFPVVYNGGGKVRRADTEPCIAAKRYIIAFLIRFTYSPTAWLRSRTPLYPGCIFSGPALLSGSIEDEAVRLWNDGFGATMICGMGEAVAIPILALPRG